MTQIERIAAIRKSIRQACKKAGIKALSVRNGAGTAWGWLAIWADDGCCFTDAEKAVLQSLGISYGGNYANMSPEEVRRRMG